MVSLISKRSALGLVAVAVIIGTFFTGVYFGSQSTFAERDTSINIYNKTEGQPETVDFGPFWTAWNILSERYVPVKEGASTTDQDKVWGAIQGLAASYNDPYTVFFPPVEDKEFKSEISGNFQGVGMEVDMKDDIITVISPLKGSPAEKAGVKAGDKILKIDDRITTGLSVEEAVNMIRGEKGTVVRITVMSEGDSQPHEVTITRDVIRIPALETSVRDDGIFVITLYNFNENSATHFRNALETFVRSRRDKLIIDLRGNPGGYLESAVDIASWFLPPDTLILKEDAGGKGEDVDFMSKGYNIFNENLKMVVLVDGGSASASEILAAALQDHGVATLVGTQTYGKGSVQQLVPVTSSTSLKITVARWLTPNGVSISEQGLTPDVVVELTEEDVKNRTDKQLDKAVEILLAQ